MATTNNIGLYCFSTGNEDAKTSLEALFGAGNSNMKKIDDAIGELRKKSFIVNTEEELNVLLTEENLGKTVSFNGALYIITEGGSSNAPIAVGDTIDKLYFNTSVEPDLTALTYEDGTAILVDGNSDSILTAIDLNAFGASGYVLMSMQPSSMDIMYASEAIEANPDLELPSASKGWNDALIIDGAYPVNAVAGDVAVVNQQDLWSSYISKEPFTSGGGGIIAKPVGAEGGGLPSFAPEDAGKFLRVDSNGNIVAEAIAYAEGESF